MCVKPAPGEYIKNIKIQCSEAIQSNRQYLLWGAIRSLALERVKLMKMLLTFEQHSQQIVDMYINWGRLITLPQTRKPLKTCPKTHPKYLPDPFQISLKSLPGTFLGAFKKKSAFLSPFGSPKWHQTTNFGAPWPPWGCQSQEKSLKNALEVSPCTHLEKTLKKKRQLSDLPEPSGSC